MKRDISEVLHVSISAFIYVFMYFYICLIDYLHISTFISVIPLFSFTQRLCENAFRPKSDIRKLHVWQQRLICKWMFVNLSPEKFT